MFPARILLRLYGSPQICRSYSAKANSLVESPAYPESPLQNHHDLPSFLKYADRIEMDTTSSVYVGTRYEYTVQSSFERLGMSLKRIGGRQDHGTDIIGTWPLPSLRQPLKLLIQCKAHAAKVTPAHARELEGSFVGAPLGWNGPGVLALLVSQQSASKGVREALGRSRWPMGHVMCSAEGKILQMVWNRRAEQEGLEGIEVGLRYYNGSFSEREVVLAWKGKALH